MKTFRSKPELAWPVTVHQARQMAGAPWQVWLIFFGWSSGFLLLGNGVRQWWDGSVTVPQWVGSVLACPIAILLLIFCVFAGVRWAGSVSIDSDGLRLPGGRPMWPWQPVDCKVEPLEGLPLFRLTIRLRFTRNSKPSIKYEGFTDNAAEAQEFCAAFSQKYRSEAGAAAG